MVIRVNDKYRIHGTESCWQVEEYGGMDKNGAPRWKTLTWHVTLESALSSLCDERIRAIADQVTAAEIMETLKTIRTEGEEALRPFQITACDRAGGAQTRAAV